MFAPLPSHFHIASQIKKNNKLMFKVSTLASKTISSYFVGSYVPCYILRF